MRALSIVAISVSAFISAMFVETASFATIYRCVDARGVPLFTNIASRGTNCRPYIQGNRKSHRVPVSFSVAPRDKDASRFSRYDEPIRQAAALYQIPELLIRAIIKVESDYDPHAISSAGARGLMQLMPETAGYMAVRDIHDPRENIFGGARLLRILANSFQGNLDYTLAAYNAGEGSVVKYRGIPPYAETRDYVVRVNHYYRLYRSMQNETPISAEP